MRNRPKEFTVYRLVINDELHRTIDGLINYWMRELHSSCFRRGRHVNVPRTPGWRTRRPFDECPVEKSRKRLAAMGLEVRRDGSLWRV
jgi:hypothetical protein